MKKILVSLLVSFGLVAVVPLTASATPHTHNTPRFVTGVVSDGGNPVKNADVSATCNGKTKGHKTNAAGFYRLQFNSRDCPDGSTVTVTASKGDKSGTKQITINGPVNTANVSISSVQVPEFGTVTSVAALAAVGGGIYMVRRKRLNNVDAL